MDHEDFPWREAVSGPRQAPPNTRGPLIRAARGPHSAGRRLPGAAVIKAGQNKQPSLRLRQLPQGVAFHFQGRPGPVPDLTEMISGTATSWSVVQTTFHIENHFKRPIRKDSSKQRLELPQCFIMYLLSLHLKAEY